MTEIEELREEVRKLREEIERLRAGGVVHHYHHQVLGPTLIPAPNPYLPAPAPMYPGGPYPVTCAATDPTWPHLSLTIGSGAPTC